MLRYRCRQLLLCGLTGGLALVESFAPADRFRKVQLRVGPDIDQADRQLEELGIAFKDLDESFLRSSGPGGQNVNKVETAVRLKHIPSGLEVKAQTHRTQLENRVSARRRLGELYKKVVLGMETKADRKAKRIRSNKARRARRRRKKEEALALEALAELGFKDSSQKILETVGSGQILDPSAPLVLRCVDRWVSEIVSNFSEADLAAATELPMPIHMPSDRYLDGLDEETRAAVIKKYIPDEPFGGTAVISNPTQCLELMKKWEEVFSSMQFQSRRKALWDRRDLSFPQRLMETRTMVAESLANVLEPMGFASGRPGLARCVKQMQVHWSTDKNCANKALDLEEMADVSLADLE